MDLHEENIHCPPAEFESVIQMPSVDFQKICRDMYNLVIILRFKVLITSLSLDVMVISHHKKL